MQVYDAPAIKRNKHQPADHQLFAVVAFRGRGEVSTLPHGVFALAAYSSINVSMVLFP